MTFILRDNVPQNVPPASYLYPVRVIIQQEDAAARHLLGLHHGLEVGQQTHVFRHVGSQDLDQNDNIFLSKKHKQKEGKENNLNFPNFCFFVTSSS